MGHVNQVAVDNGEKLPFSSNEVSYISKLEW